MNTQNILVPRLSTLPVHEPRARAILRWLVRKDIVEEQLSTCGRSGNRMAYAIGPGARNVVEQPDLLPYGQPVNGLEVVTDRCIFTPVDGFLFLQPCAFSNLGFIFNNWGQTSFKPAFIAEFADWLDQPIAQVLVKFQDN